MNMFVTFVTLYRVVEHLM